MPRLALVAALIATVALSGCDMLGLDSAEKHAAQRDAEGRAIGGACRHASRAIEDCYALNKKADKAAVFNGWRDMNDYMRENKIEPVEPQLGAGAKGGKAEDKAEAKDEEPADTKPAKKSAEH